MDKCIEIANEIIVHMDVNQDGMVSLEEFSEQYIELIKRLRMRQIEMEDKMIEHYEQYKFNVKSMEGNSTSMTEGKCQLKIVEVHNIP